MSSVTLEEQYERRRLVGALQVNHFGVVIRREAPRDGLHLKA